MAFFASEAQRHALILSESRQGVCFHIVASSDVVSHELNVELLQGQQKLCSQCVADGAWRSQLVDGALRCLRVNLEQAVNELACQQVAPCFEGNQHGQQLTFGHECRIASLCLEAVPLDPTGLSEPQEDRAFVRDRFVISVRLGCGGFRPPVERVQFPNTPSNEATQFLATEQTEGLWP